MNRDPEWRSVPFREYPEPLNLFGRDFISLLNCSKDEVSKVVGTMATPSEMPPEELPETYVTTMTGELADEVHEWPNATLGPEFRHLMLQFSKGRLVGFRWSMANSATQRAKPWWKFW